MKKIVISQKLKDYRCKNKVTQKQLGDLLGITPQSISKWERGECYPDIALLPTLADAIDCAVDEFFA
ncbi:MAG: helix-turn-helix transcriptional regulator [Ruminococcaceae bacterium]|nr:helix-turn-helix transcriptional regulator [Oscillospiraceae bacterium]